MQHPQKQQYKNRAAQFMHPIIKKKSHYKSMKFNILQKLNCTISSPYMINLYRFPAQFNQISQLFLLFILCKALIFNQINVAKQNFTCTNYSYYQNFQLIIKHLAHAQFTQLPAQINHL